MLRAAAALALLLVLAPAAQARSGRLDPSFGGDRGYVRLGEGFFANRVFALPRGRTDVLVDSARLLELRPGGTTALSVGLGALVDDLVRSRDGTYAGLEQVPAGLRLRRFDADGAPLGAADAPYARNVSAQHLAVRPDGGWVAHAVDGDEFRDWPVLAGFAPDGTPDPAFPVTAYAPRGAEYDSAIAVDSKGRTYLVNGSAQRCGRRGRNLLVVSRFGPTGARDTRYGVRRLTFARRRGQCAGAAVGDAVIDTRGRLLVAFAAPGLGARVARLRPSGRRDRRFGRRGVARTGFDAVGPAKLALARRGRIVLATTDAGDDEHVAVVRLLGSGRIDPRFGRTHTPVTRAFPSSFATDVDVDRRGRVVVAGAMYDNEAFGFREDYGTPHATVWRLKVRSR